MNKKTTNYLLFSLLAFGAFAQQPNESSKGDLAIKPNETAENIKKYSEDIKNTLRYGTYDISKNYYYDVLKKKTTRDGVPYYNMGLIMLAENKTDSAKYFFNTGLRKQFDYAINNLGIAKLSLESGKEKEANSKFNALIAQTQNPTPELFLDIAKVYIDSPKGDVEKAKEYVQRALDLDPNNMMARLIEGDAYLKEGQNKIAEVIYRKTMKAFPDEVEPKLRLAKLYRDYNLFNDAIPLYEKAIEQKPEHPAAYRDLALAYQDFADFSNNDKYLKKASEYYTKFYELLPTSIDIDNQYADFLVDIEDFDKLTEWLEDKWVTRGDNFIIYRFAAISAYELGNKNQAYLYEKKYFDVQDQLDKITPVDRFYLGLGEISHALSLKEFDQTAFDNGIAKVEAAVAEKPKLANRIYRSALPIFKDGKYEQAYHLFNQGTKNEKTKFYIENLYYKATSLFQIANRGIVPNALNDAAMALDKVIELSPNSIEAYLMNARVNRDIDTPESKKKMLENYRMYVKKVKENRLENEPFIQETLKEAESYIK